MKRCTDPDVQLLQAAADPHRLLILRQLSAGNRVSACEFKDCCGVGQPTVSHHLHVLKTAGWVTSERRGSWIYYRLRPEAVARFRELAGEIELRPTGPTGVIAAVAVPLLDMPPAADGRIAPASGREVDGSPWDVCI